MNMTKILWTWPALQQWWTLFFEHDWKIKLAITKNTFSTIFLVLLKKNNVKEEKSPKMAKQKIWLQLPFCCTSTQKLVKIHNIYESKFKTLYASLQCAQLDHCSMNDCSMLFYFKAFVESKMEELFTLPKVHYMQFQVFQSFCIFIKHIIKLYKIYGKCPQVFMRHYCPDYLSNGCKLLQTIQLFKTTFSVEWETKLYIKMTCHFHWLCCIYAL